MAACLNGVKGTALTLNRRRGRASVLRYTAQQLMQDVRKEVREKEAVVNPESDQVEDLIESAYQTEDPDEETAA